MDQKPQHDVKYPKSHKEKVGKSLELIGIGKEFLNQILKAQALRPTVNK